MVFRIAGRDYAVVISARPIVRGGIQRSAWFDFTGGRILISDEMPREDRRRAVFHELRHAWTAAHGVPGDGESDAASVGTFLDLMLEQFETQGGNAALAALDPVGEGIPKIAAPARAVGSTATCGCCSGLVAVGSIVDSEPIWRPTYGCFSLNRGMFCEACGNVTTWAEKCSNEGEPLSEVLGHPKPKVLRGPAAAKWLNENACLV